MRPSHLVVSARDAAATVRHCGVLGHARSVASARSSGASAPAAVPSTRSPPGGGPLARSPAVITAAGKVSFRHLVEGAARRSDILAAHATGGADTILADLEAGLSRAIRPTWPTRPSPVDPLPRTLKGDLDRRHLGG